MLCLLGKYIARMGDNDMHSERATTKKKFTTVTIDKSVL